MKILIALTALVFLPVFNGLPLNGMTRAQLYFESSNSEGTPLLGKDFNLELKDDLTCNSTDFNGMTLAQLYFESSNSEGTPLLGKDFNLELKDDLTCNSTDDLTYNFTDDLEKNSFSTGDMISKEPFCLFQNTYNIISSENCETDYSFIISSKAIEDDESSFDSDNEEVEGCPLELSGTSFFQKHAGTEYLDTFKANFEKDSFGEETDGERCNCY
ncbi:hypothetical protein MDAP_002562 [Mitosporidium daphniae]